MPQAVIAVIAQVAAYLAAEGIKNAFLQFVVSTLVSTAVSALGAWAFGLGRVKRPDVGGGYTIPRMDPSPVRRHFYGKVRDAGTPIFRHTRDGYPGDGNDMFTEVRVHCVGPGSVDKWLVNSTEVTVNASRLVTSAPYERADGWLTGGTNGNTPAWLLLESTPGTYGQSSSIIASDEAPSKWGANDRCRTACLSIVRATFFRTHEGSGIVFPTGFPDVTPVWKGKNVYDPRKDDTRGGVGAHRLSDPLTWEWSDNPILCAWHYYFFCENGYGADVADVDESFWPHVAAEANKCDVTRAKTFPIKPNLHQLIISEPLYRFWGVISEDDDPRMVMETFAQSCGGWFTEAGGYPRLYVGQHWEPNFSLSDNDFLTFNWSPRRPRSDLFNTVRGTFIDPENNYQEIQYPEVSDASAVTADGAIIPEARDFPFSPSAYQAQELAYIALRRNRTEGAANASCKLRALGFRAGEYATINFTALGFTQRTMFVREYKLAVAGEENPALSIEVTFDASSASIYDRNTMELTELNTPESVDASLNLPDQGWII